jgi:hypothetical protein
MKSLFYSYNQKVDKAYIIRVKGHEVSEQKASECAASCRKVGMPYDFWDAYDGTGDTIITPSHHNIVMDLIKIMDHYMTKGEVACALSHISLWAKCIQQDKPLVVLEHDAIMVKPFLEHATIGTLCYLGGREQAKFGWPVYPTPPHASEGPNYHFICRAHAYSIDPQSAKNLLAYVIKYGLTGPLDIIMRTDLFPVVQFDLCAYDEDNGTKVTTIKGRDHVNEEGKPAHRPSLRNDNLTF